MKYISLLLIAAGWELINAVCVPTGICTYNEILFTWQITDTFAYNISILESLEYSCDGDIYDAIYYNDSSDCTGASVIYEDVIEGLVYIYRYIDIFMHDIYVF